MHYEAQYTLKSRVKFYSLILAIEKTDYKYF